MDNILNLLWLLPALPLCGFLILAIFGSKFPKSAIATIGIGTVGISALLAIIIGISFLTQTPPGNSYSQTLWTWFNVSGFSPSITFYLDPLSLVFCFVVTFVGFLIHWYSAEFMENDEGYARFFAYMNLFICAMLVLVLADDLLLMYMGWEGVGLCSFLLIGFWYKDEINSAAARKAFIVTRIGDTMMLIGLFLLVKSFGTLNMNAILSAAPEVWGQGSSQAFWGAFLLLGGAVGKSAQFPLQVWLPDAMAGPSPVSALIHAATMVTAGVFLIARMHVLFDLAPAVQMIVAIIGAATLLIAGFSALMQNDLKRVLAYSTISQIGYMFLALGLGAYSAAVFHFFVHAFFKSLLFLAAGAVILALNDEHDIRKMGGLRKKMPVVFWTFLFGAAALASLPLVTAGFYSKDEIIWYAFAADKGSFWLWLCAFAGAFITSIYTFRMVFLTFFGEQKTKISFVPGNRIKIPLIILGVLSLIAGFIQMPEWLGGFAPFSSFLNTMLPAVSAEEINGGVELLIQSLSIVFSLLGIWIAWMFFKKPRLLSFLKTSAVGRKLSHFLINGWQFDWLYDHLLVKPVVWLSRIDKEDFVGKIYDGVGDLNFSLNKLFSRTENGNIRWYTMGIAIGAVITLTIILFL